MKRLINIGFLFCLFISAQVRASPILTGDVSFDNITHLYTYTYTIDTTQNATITELSIVQNLGTNFSEPSPISHTQPDGWNFVNSVGGISEPGEHHIFGSYWAWQNFASVGNNELLTFSFTTERGVNTTPENNYFMFDPYGTSGTPAFPGVIVGKVVGPEFVTINEVPVSTIPENETYALMMAGLGIVGFMARRNSKRSDSSI
ncbi:MAG: hypothetical protein H0W85_04540 [Methylotenera sp.]|nr:hypothetical protein [Methylotenera sp.]